VRQKSKIWGKRGRNRTRSLLFKVRKAEAIKGLEKGGGFEGAAIGSQRGPGEAPRIKPTWLQIWRGKGGRPQTAIIYDQLSWILA